MAGGTASGKATLRVERLEASPGSPWRFDVSATILTCKHASRLHREAVLEGIREDFSCCEYAIHPLPEACYRIAVGWRLTIKVVYVCEWGRDYFGEGWSDLQYMKECVIRRQPPTREPYLSKAQRAEIAAHEDRERARRQRLRSGSWV